MLETISAREIDRYIFNKNYFFWKGYGDWEKRSRFCTVTEAG